MIPRAPWAFVAAQPRRSAAAVSLSGWPQRSGGLEFVFTAARAAERSRERTRAKGRVRCLLSRQLAVC